MDYTTFQLETVPELSSPVVIVGFRGWGNALEVASGMATYLVDSLQGRAIGRLDSDACYRYDENRPMVTIESGRISSINPPGGSLFAVATAPDESDLLVLIADEPSLQWHRFSWELVELAREVGARQVISLGSMFDHVLHSDRIISAATTGHDQREVLDHHGVLSVNYQGPGAIHTVILEACRKQGLPGASLWCHCPAYLQGITHSGLMLNLARLLADMARFSIETEELASRWETLEVQIRDLIAENPKLEGIMDEIRRKKRQGAWQNLQETGGATDNVINLQDFIDP